MRIFRPLSQGRSWSPGRLRLALGLLAATTALGLPGCVRVNQPEPESGPVKTVREEIELGKAEMVRTEVTIGAGELSIDGGAAKLLDAEFRYNVPFLKPVVRYDAAGFRGRLEVTQEGERKVTLGDVENRWTLRLNDRVPLDLIIRMGAGESRLKLGSLNLRRVDVNLGAGEVDMDLRGTPSKDYDVDIRGGVGQATVRLPSNVGIEAIAKGGIGEISVRGLTKDGNRYRNSLYGQAPVNIRLDVTGGVGQIELIVDSDDGR